VGESHPLDGVAIDAGCCIDRASQDSRVPRNPMASWWSDSSAKARPRSPDGAQRNPGKIVWRDEEPGLRCAPPATDHRTTALARCLSGGVALVLFGGQRVISIAAR